MAKGLNPQELKALLPGIFNIQFTPFKSMDEIDVEALKIHTNYLVEGGLVNGKGVTVIAGSNGEGFSLTDEEYRILVDTVVETVDGRLPVVVGLLRAGTKPMIDLAKYVKEAGGDGVMVLSPYYHGNASDDQVYTHFKLLAEAVDIGIIIYNNVGVTGKDIQIPLIERLAMIENIVGWKETTRDMYKLRKVATMFKDRFVINTNTYRWNMPLDYQMGVKGFNTVFGNIKPSIALEMHEAGLSGDFDVCQNLWERMLPLYDYVFGGNVAYHASALGKEMVRIAGLPMGDFERHPMTLPTEEESSTLEELMTEAGMLD